MYRQVKGIDLFKMRGDVANDFELDFGGALGFAKLPPQTLARAIAQMRAIIVKITKVKRQPRHRHARNTGETVVGKSGGSTAGPRGEILQTRQGRLASRDD